jgi:8-oxo-dGTP pyrophosphatase MutT (NUDIX family)
MSTQPLLLDDALRARVRGNLARFERQTAADSALRPAAVALVITDDGVADGVADGEADGEANGEAGRASFVLTRRSRGLRNHPGQWALPGGRLDAGESASDAALRELDEEVGLRLPADAILGLLDDYPTRSGFAITPVVVWGGPGCALDPNPEEVAEVYRVPLEDLYAPGVPRLRQIPESDRPVISVPLVGANIHAPTAAVLYQLSEVALWGRETRVDHFEQPVFAWS